MDNIAAADKDSAVNFYVAPQRYVVSQNPLVSDQSVMPGVRSAMNRLFEATEPSFVPLWKVQYSRMMLLSPISTPDASSASLSSAELSDSWKSAPPAKTLSEFQLCGKSSFTSR